MALSGTKTALPLSMQDRTVVMYKDEVLWKERLEVSDERKALNISIPARYISLHCRNMPDTSASDTEAAP